METENRHKKSAFLEQMEEQIYERSWEREREDYDKHGIQAVMLEHSAKSILGIILVKKVYVKIFIRYHSGQKYIGKHKWMITFLMVNRSGWNFVAR
jgi:hypothetical protein